MVTGTQGLQWAVECQSAAKSHAACESSSKWVTQHLGCLCSSSWEQETSPPQQAVPWGSGGSSPGPACPCVVFPPPLPGMRCRRCSSHTGALTLQQGRRQGL